MSEQEFLESFLKFWKQECLSDTEKAQIRIWLTYHHRQYYEVEFIRKDSFPGEFKLFEREDE